MKRSTMGAALAVAALTAFCGRADGLVKGVITCAQGQAPYPFLCAKDAPTEIFTPWEYSAISTAPDMSYLPEGDPVPRSAYSYYAWTRDNDGAKPLYYVFTGLTPNATYTVNLYVLEPFSTSYSYRQFYAKFNDVQDGQLIHAGEAGHVGNTCPKFTPWKWVFTGKTADADGKLKVGFKGKSDNPLFCAITVEGANLPSAPGTLTGEKVGANAVLTWEPGTTDVLGYRIESRVGEGAWGEVAQTVGTNATVAIPTVPTVEYRVVATNGNGNVAGAKTVTLQGSPMRRYAVYCGDGETPIGPFVPVFPFVSDAALKHWQDGTPSAPVGEYASYAALYAHQATPYLSGTSFRFPGLTAGKSYKLRLHTIEAYYSQAGKRTFDIYINGERIREAFDPFVEGGNVNNKPLQIDFTAVADAQGVVTYTVSNRVDQAIQCGFEIFAADDEGLLAPPLKVIAGRAYNVIVPHAGCAADTYEVEVDDGTGARTLATGVAWKGCRDYRTGDAVRSYRARINANGVIGPWSDWVAAEAPSRWPDDPLRLMCCNGTPSKVPEGWVHDKPFRVMNRSFSGGYGAGASIIYPKGLVDPAPREVMGSSLFINDSSVNNLITHVIEGLDPTIGYKLRIHVAEDWSGITAKGGRHWRIGVNRVTRLSCASYEARTYRQTRDIDPFYLGGGVRQTAGIIEHVGVRADATGKLVLQGVYAAQNPLYRGLEIIPEVSEPQVAGNGRNAWYRNGQTAKNAMTNEAFVAGTVQQGFVWTAADVPAGCDTGAIRLRSRHRFYLPAAKACTFRAVGNGTIDVSLDGERPTVTGTIGTTEGTATLTEGVHEIYVSYVVPEGTAFGLTLTGGADDGSWTLGDAALAVDAPVDTGDWKFVQMGVHNSNGSAAFRNAEGTCARLSGHGCDTWGTVADGAGLMRLMPRGFDCQFRIRGYGGRGWNATGRHGLLVTDTLFPPSGNTSFLSSEDHLYLFYTWDGFTGNLIGYCDADERSGVFKIDSWAGNVSDDKELYAPVWMRVRRLPGQGANGKDRLVFSCSTDERFTWRMERTRDIDAGTPLWVGPNVCTYWSNGKGSQYELTVMDIDNLTCVDTTPKGMILILR